MGKDSSGQGREKMVGMDAGGDGGREGISRLEKEINDGMRTGETGTEMVWEMLTRTHWNEE